MWALVAVSLGFFGASGCILRSVATQDGHVRGVRTLWISEDGRLIVSGGVDGRVLLWDAESRKRVHTLLPFGGYLDHPRPGEPRAYRGTYVFRTPDGVAQPQAPPDPSIRWAGLSRDGTRVIAVTARDTVVWDRNNGEQLARFGRLADRRVRHAACDGRFVLRILGSEATAAGEVWDVEQQQRIATLPSAAAWLAPASAETRTLAYWHEGMLVVATLPEMKIRCRLTGLSRAPEAVRFSHDGRRLAAVDRAAALRVWDVPSGRLLVHESVRERPTDKPAVLSSVVFSKDESHVAACDGSTVAVCNLAAGRTRRVRIPSGPPVRLVLLRDDGCAVAVSQAHALRDVVWVVDPAAPRVMRAGSHADQITAVAARSDLLATGSSANKNFENVTIRLWRWAGP